MEQEVLFFDYYELAKKHLLSLTGIQLNIAYLALNGMDFDEIAQQLELSEDYVYDEFERICWFLAHENGNLDGGYVDVFAEGIRNSEDLS